MCFQVRFRDGILLAKLSRQQKDDPPGLEAVKICRVTFFWGAGEEGREMSGFWMNYTPVN